MTESMTGAGPAAVDWADLRQRLAKLQVLLGEEEALPPDSIRKILTSRARALAEIRTSDSARAELLDFVEFRLGGETYALESAEVVEVVRTLERSRLPGAPPPVAGLAAWRGELLPVLNLEAMLRIDSTAPDAARSYVVAGGQRAAFVIAVDEVLGLRSLAMDELLPLSADAPRDGLVRGMTGDAVLVLSLEHLIRTYS